MQFLHALICHRSLVNVGRIGTVALTVLATQTLLSAQQGANQAEGTAQSKPVQSPEKEAVAALKDALRRAKAKDYRGFIQYCMPVEVVRRLRNQGDYDELLKKIEQNPQGFDRIVGLLEKVQEGVPQFNASKTEAMFREPPPKEDKPATPKPPAKPKTTDVKFTGYGDDLGKVIDKAIAALEAGKAAEFVSNMFPAGELRRPDADKRQKQIVAGMTPESAAITQMIADLKAIKQVKPKLKESGSVAVYEIAGGTIVAGRQQRKLPKRNFKLQKVEGSWRFYDNTTPARHEIARQSTGALPKLGPQKGTFVKFEKLGDAWRIQEFSF